MTQTQATWVPPSSRRRVFTGILCPARTTAPATPRPRLGCRAACREYPGAPQPGTVRYMTATTTPPGGSAPPFGRMLTAMITPMTGDGAVDYAGAARLAEYLVT